MKLFLLLLSTVLSSPHRVQNTSEDIVFSTQIMCQSSINCTTTFCTCPHNQFCVNGTCARSTQKKFREKNKHPIKKKFREKHKRPRIKTRTKLSHKTLTETIKTTTVVNSPITLSTKVVNSPITLPTTVVSGTIPITFGNKATVTFFSDTIFQCLSGQPTGNALAINPLLLGFTADDWTNLYANADPSSIPWCGKTLTLVLNGQTFSGEIIDTCDPTGSNPFTDPNTGKIIGGKCDYPDVIDLYGDAGLAFLKKVTNGDDFYQGNLSWEII